MRYTVYGFQQAALIKYGIDATDVIILRYVVDFFSSGSMRHVEINQKRYFWLLHQNILNNLPFLGIKKQALADRMKKLSAKGVLDCYIDRNDQGTFAYYRFHTKAYDELIGDDTGCSELQVKDASIKDASIRKQKNPYSPLRLEEVPEPVRPMIEEFLQYRKAIGKKMKTQKALTALVNKLKTLSGGNLKLARLIIDQSMENEWQTVFPLKTDNGRPQESTSNRPSRRILD